MSLNINFIDSEEKTKKNCLSLQSQKHIGQVAHIRGCSKSHLKNKNLGMQNSEARTA